MLVNGRIVEKEVVRLDDMDSHVDCQVVVVDERVKDIADNYNPIDLGMLTVVRVNRRFIIIDGQHRRSALKMLGIDSAECWVYYNVDESEFKNIFDEVNMKQHGCKRHEQYSSAKIQIKEDTRNSRLDNQKSSTWVKELLSGNGIIFEPKEHRTKTTYHVSSKLPNTMPEIFKVMDDQVYVDKNKYNDWVVEIKKLYNENEKERKELERKTEEWAKKKEELENKKQELKSKHNAEIEEINKIIKSNNANYTNFSYNKIIKKLGGLYNNGDSDVDKRWVDMYSLYNDVAGFNSTQKWTEYKRKNKISISKIQFVATELKDVMRLFDCACEIVEN